MSEINQQNGIKHGFISFKARKLFGSSIYVGTNGEEVEVTCVSEHEEPVNYKWEDTAYVGLVTKWLRKGHEGELRMGNYYQDPKFSVIPSRSELRSILDGFKTMNEVSPNRKDLAKYQKSSR